MKQTSKKKVYFLIFVCAFSFSLGIKLIYQHLYQPFYDVSYSEIKEKIEKKENFILFIGRPSCPECVATKNRMTKELNSQWYQPIPKKIAYYNTDKHRNEVEFESMVKEYDLTYVPKIFYFKKGIRLPDKE